MPRGSGWGNDLGAGHARARKVTTAFSIFCRRRARPKGIELHGGAPTRSKPGPMPGYANPGYCSSPSALLPSRSRVEEGVAAGRASGRWAAGNTTQATHGIAMAKRWSRAGALILTVVVLASLSQAQQVPPGPGGPPPRPLPPPQAKAPASKEAPPPSSEGSLQRRVEQLEEQLVDLQVVIGTLESLAKGGIAPPPPSARRWTRAPPTPAASMPRDADARAGLADGEPAGAAAQPADRPVAGRVRLRDRGTRSRQREGRDRPVAPAPPGGGKVAVAPPPAEPRRRPSSSTSGPTATCCRRTTGTPKRRFEDFLKRHPSHQLAGNAQYWLGETFYVRGQYRRRRRAPSSRATRTTPRARRRPRACSSSPCRCSGWARRMPPARPSTSSPPSFQARRRM